MPLQPQHLNKKEGFASLGFLLGLVVKILKSLIPLRGIPPTTSPSSVAFGDLTGPTMMVATDAPTKSVSLLGNRKNLRDAHTRMCATALISLRKVSRRQAGTVPPFSTHSNKSERSRETSGNFHAGEIDRVFSWEISAVVRMHERGAALLATTLAVMLILVAVGASMISSGLFEGFLSDTQADALEAYAAAQSGIKDASLRIARNKSFTHTGYFIPTGCTLNTTDTTCTKVIVEKDSATLCSQSLSLGQDCVISAGTAGSRTRTVEVILSVDATNGKITQVSWKEL